MARGKKKESTLTPEEKLAQALVPDWEQPYKVPKNWCWTTLGYAAKFVRGSSPRPIKAYQTESEDGVNWIKIGDTDSGKYINSVKEKITKQGALKSVPVHKGDLLLTNSMSYGKPFILNIDGYIHDGWFALVPSPCIDKEFLYYSCLASEWYFDKIAVGAAVRNISTDRTVTTPIAIPPLGEQRRIVERIEYLFAKLDEAKEKSQSVLDSFETRKAAILHKAFTGELTANWRSEHGVDLESWTDESLQSVCSMKITDGTHKTPVYCDADVGVPFISAKDVTGEVICWDNIKHIVPELHEELYKRLAPQIDDVLLAKNGTTGVAAIVEEEKIFDLYVTLAVLRPNKQKILPRYLLRVVNSPVCKNQFDAHLTGMGVPNLHLRDIKEVAIKAPTLAEQAAIIKIADSIMSKEQQVKESAEAVLEKIDLLKKSILARAFRGELGTNDPTEESALELLKQVLR